jgi:small subunit ribosomal protein S18
MPDFRETDNLSRFLSPRKKILGRIKTGTCAKHQRRLTKHIKYAQHLGMLPFISYQGQR